MFPAARSRAASSARRWSGHAPVRRRSGKQAGESDGKASQRGAMAVRRPWVKTRVFRERRRRLQIIHGRCRICPRLDTLHCTISGARPEGTVKKRSRFATEPHNLKPGRFRPVGPFCFQISKFSVDWPHAARLAWIIPVKPGALRSEEHTSELQSLMRISYAVFCLKKKKPIKTQT